MSPESIVRTPRHRDAFVFSVNVSCAVAPFDEFECPRPRKDGERPARASERSATGKKVRRAQRDPLRYGSSERGADDHQPPREGDRL
jgi:hypothetical protein